MNCGAIAPSLITSALFGYEKRAFPGAIHRHPDVSSSPGAIFLDEVVDLAKEAQVAFLCVLPSDDSRREANDRECARRLTWPCRRPGWRGREAPHPPLHAGIENPLASDR